MSSASLDDDPEPRLCPECSMPMRLHAWPDDDPMYRATLEEWCRLMATRLRRQRHADLPA